MPSAERMPWWKRPAAPGPLVPELGTYLLILLPAVLGAALAWRSWLALVLMIPGIAVYQLLIWAGARARGLQTRGQVPQRFYVVLGGITGALCGVGVNVVPSRYGALVVAIAGTAASLAVRAWWRDHDRRDGLRHQSA